MRIPVLNSVKSIEQRYSTGEEPVLVMCSDKKSYICKYMRTSASAYKLMCELIGSQMAEAWGLNTPAAAFVNIKPVHWPMYMQHCISVPSFGYGRLSGVVDVTPSTYKMIDSDMEHLSQLLHIALFDFWIANEDRNANNANLLYDIENSRIISIDYGCILNTATFDFSISQLTSTDTILYSPLFFHLAQGKKKADVLKIADYYLQESYHNCVAKALKRVEVIKNFMPVEWNVSFSVVAGKLSELFEKQWIDAVRENFVECLKENMKNG